MTELEFTKRAQAYALEIGCDGCEVYRTGGESFEVNASGGEIDRYSVSRDAGISARVSIGGKNGYAYTELFEEPEKLVDRAADNARCIETEDVHPMQKLCSYRAVERKPSALAAFTEQERIALAKRLETLVLAADPRVQRVGYCSAEYGSSSISLDNTNGCSAFREGDFSIIFAMPSVQEGDEVQTGFAFRMGADAADAEGCAREAVRNATSKLGAKPVESGCYGVILENYALCDLLAAFSPMFSAEEAQKGCSLMAGKEGETVASGIVTLWDDPFDAIAPRAFDAEGTPCKKKAVIEKGVLKTLFHNLKTAQKAGVESTGNASRPRASSPLGVAPTVLKLEPGELSYDALVAKLGRGLVITELDGLHAGVDAISGDFSLKATGFFVEDGAVKRPVSGITIAGNFITMMKDVAALGSDLKFAIPQSGYFGAPSVLVNSLSVAGT